MAHMSEKEFAAFATSRNLNIDGKPQLEQPPDGVFRPEEAQDRTTQQYRDRQYDKRQMLQLQSSLDRLVAVVSGGFMIIILLMLLRGH